MINKLDQFILARYFYRVGEFYISDAEYDLLVNELEGVPEASEYLSRTYDDDVVPTELLKQIGYAVDIHVERDEEVIDSSFLAEDKSMSIRKVDTMAETFDFFNAFKGEEFCLSIKMDGDNIKSEVLDGDWKLSLTRGRDSAGINVTTAMRYVIPKSIELPGHYIVTGEVFVPEEHLHHLKESYDDTKYKTTRTGAMTILRRPRDHKQEDIELMKFVVFSCDGLADSVSATYEKLKESGFEVSPYMVLSNIPTEFEEFSSWFENLMDDMYNKQKDLGLPADGLVLETNRFNVDSTVKDQYDSRQIAIKFKHWSPSIYTGVIKRIVVEQRRVFCCCKVEIEPTQTDDGCTATTINIFNPSFLLDFDLGVGDKVRFERQSGTINVLVNDK